MFFHRLRLGFALVSHVYGVLGGLLAGQGIGQRGHGRVGNGRRRVELLLADHVLLDQRLVALQVRLRLGVVGLSLRHLGMGRGQLLLGLGHRGLEAAYVGVGGAQVAGRIDGDDGHVHVGRRGVGLGAGKYICVTMRVAKAGPKREK